MKDQTGKAPELGQQSVLKVSEVAKLMGLNRATVFHAIHQGKLVATRVPDRVHHTTGVWEIKASDFRDWQQRRLA